MTGIVAAAERLARLVGLNYPPIWNMEAIVRFQDDADLDGISPSGDTMTVKSQKAEG